MDEMTTHERVSRMFAHQEADRIPITDIPWGATLERWHAEGLPEDVNWADFFEMDKFVQVGMNVSPRYEVKVLEENEEYKISTSPWGATSKSWKHKASTPEFLDYKVVDRESWSDARARMTPTPDRLPWDLLEAHYKQWREEGAWMQIGFWFGFDVTHSWMMGTENVLMLMGMDPDLLVEIFNHYLDMNISLAEMMLDKGYTFDAITWPDDMGYKFHTFFSVDAYRNLLKPVHKRAIDWAHSKGMKAEMHSCGDVHTFVPEFVDMGLDGLNPLEVKAGMDPGALKAEFGDRLLFHGGINALLYEDFGKLEAQVRETVPVMKQDGGYIFSIHSVPSSVSLEEFQRLVKLAKEVGRYD